MKDDKDIEKKKKNKRKIFSVKKKEKTEKQKVKKDSYIKISNPKENGVSFSLIEVIVIIIITSLIISVCSGLIVFNNYDKFSSVRSEENKTDLSEFIESYNHIINSYVKEVDKGELINAAIKGMYNYLNDAYSIYIDEDVTETITERLEGQYEGIGIEISMNEKGEIIVLTVFGDSPAEKAGLKENDIIVSLDGVSYKDKTTSELSSAIKDSDKSDFVIGYTRDGKESTVKVERKQVLIDSVKSKVYGNTGYIQLDNFSATTSEQVEQKLVELDPKIKSLIIDLRYNTGGYLSAAYDVSSLFVNKGDIIYQLKTKNGTITKRESEQKPVRKFDKITILVNEGTASASEILAAALRDNLGAKLVGKNTFGKGTVQETDRLSSGAMVKYTTSYWLTPKGESINEIGLIPDYDVNQNIETEDDEVLQKALEITK